MQTVHVVYKPTHCKSDVENYTFPEKIALYSLLHENLLIL